jgi:hypothetical protein
MTRDTESWSLCGARWVGDNGERALAGVMSRVAAIAVTPLTYETKNNDFTMILTTSQLTST